MIHFLPCKRCPREVARRIIRKDAPQLCSWCQDVVSGRKRMQCKTCGETESWHNWKQKPYCSPYCGGAYKSTGSVSGEWTRNAKAELEANIDDVQQPLRRDGTINPHFVKVHGTKVIEKEFKATKRDIMREVERYG